MKRHEFHLQRFDLQRTHFRVRSRRDVQKVRQIRNKLERRGHNPLLFFLKCLEDDDTRLPELICEELN